ncbi:archaemetzincin [Paraliomyxa miuraensis]|uniref:archaemetzincin n=1 Tax=Paraliomyxa miuraensis TaxID=376150 RepID=UPI002256FB2A|nr:archaemetzincin [Paraliomyxa miuraensis]MCX4247287.1 archaemetzincin [Paraliomyxa miuraensis]
MRTRWASAVLLGALGCGGPLELAHGTGSSDPPPLTPAAHHAHEDPAELLADAMPETLLPWLDPSAFDPLPPPRPGSWRDRVHEPPQSLAELARSPFNRPVPGRDTLVLLPLGSFPTELVIEGDELHTIHTPELHELRGFVSAYFGLPVDVVTPIPIEPLDIPTQQRHGRACYDARGIIDAVAPVLPEHAHSMIVLINRELVSGPEQSFGFGYATHHERLAVMSFSRIDPRRTGSAPGTSVEEVGRARAYKLLAHELAHTFGLRHCDHYACVMNGIADEHELDQTPLHLCPECLRKLLFVGGMDPEARYRALADWYSEHGLENEARWIRQRLASAADAALVERPAST